MRVIRCNYVAAAALAAALLATSVGAHAQQPSAGAADPAAEPAAAGSTTVATPASDAAAANPAASDPFLVQLRAGDAAYLARDFDAAAASFREAIKLDPRNPLGHYRLGETLRAQQRHEEASEALSNALRFATTLTLQARINFIIGDTHERANQLPKAKLEWERYVALAKQHAEQVVAKAQGVSAADPIFPDAGAERLSRVDAAIARFAEYAAVKERIKRREAELDAQTRGKPQVDEKE